MGQSVGASVRAKEKSLHVVGGSGGLRHMELQGSVLFVARAVGRREANCLIGYMADGNRKHASRQAALAGVVSGLGYNGNMYRWVGGSTVLC